MPADMPEFEFLAETYCPPGADCEKVARDRNRPGKIQIVAKRITDPAALDALGVGPDEVAGEIDESLYREGYHGLDRGEPA